MFHKISTSDAPRHACMSIHPPPLSHSRAVLTVKLPLPVRLLAHNSSHSMDASSMARWCHWLGAGGCLMCSHYYRREQAPLPNVM